MCVHTVCAGILHLEYNLLHLILYELPLSEFRLNSLTVLTTFETPPVNTPSEESPQNIGNKGTPSDFGIGITMCSNSFRIFIKYFFSSCNTFCC